jgi:hypothetical protein
MPHLRLYHVDPGLAAERASLLVDRLTAALGCERSWLTLEIVPSMPLDTGSGEGRRPFVEVLWFERPAELRKATAAIIAEELRGKADYLTTVFFDLRAGDYFENGEPV